MGSGKSIITDKPVAFQTPPASMTPRVGWDVNRFETLIQTQGYDAFIDRAFRCPCCDKTSGQALSTCKNCLSGSVHQTAHGCSYGSFSNGCHFADGLFMDNEFPMDHVFF